MSFARSIARRQRLGAAANFQVEGLERRVLLSSAIAAFGAQQTFAVGSQPRAVAIADVNLDGKPDLLIANTVSNTVSVLMGNGNGTFQPQQTFAAGAGPFAIAVADVNGDGKPDLVVADNGGNAISVLLGNGNGTFHPQQSFATGSNPRAIAVADLNGDGKLDVVTANYASNTVSVLLGNGNGTFQPQRTFATGSQPRAIAVADIRNRGIDDLLVANHGDNSLTELAGNGDGTFSFLVNYPVDAAPWSVAVGDFNGDSHPDVAVACGGGNDIRVLQGTGDGAFIDRLTLATGAGPIALATADVNGDGHLDLVVANYNANNIGVLLGNPDGSFQAQKTFAVGASPRWVALADINLDGRVDVVVANANANTVSVLSGDVPPVVLSINRANPVGPTTSASSVSFTVTFSEPVTGVDPTDFSLDVGGVTAATPVVVSGSGSVYTVTINGIMGTGTLGLVLVDDATIYDAAGNPLQRGDQLQFQPQPAVPLGNAVRPASVAVADFNGDGKPDLAVAETGYAAVDVILGNGDGSFQDLQPIGAGSYPVAVAAADVNGDGHQDLIVGNDKYGSTGDIGVLLGNGTGFFQPEQTFVSGANVFSIAVADVNGDGKPDIVATNYLDNTVSVLLGNGNGTFQPRQTFAAGPHPTSVAIADLNHDGKPDLVVADNQSDTVSVLLGNGNGTFQAQATFVADGAPWAVAVADLNHDGNPDIAAVSNIGGGTVSVLQGNGNGTFLPPQTFSTGSFPFSLSISDVNGDGRPDLVVANRSSNSVSVLLGNGDGTFQPQQVFSVGSSPFFAAVADVNQDGAADLVVANSASSTLSVLLGNTNSDFFGQTYTITGAPPLVTAINRSSPLGPATNANSVSYAVTFSQSVSGVTASDFQVVTSGAIAASLPVVVSGSGSSYGVTVNGIHGSGTLQLELIDNDTIIDGSGMPLGGVGIGNGSFVGQSYTILQTFPTVLSINRSNPVGPNTSATSVSFAVTFSGPVTGVNASDFTLALSGISATTPVLVSGSGASYTVTVNGISGSGTLGLELVDDGSIRDVSGNPLQGAGVPSFQTQMTFQTGVYPSSVAMADLNGDGRPDLVVANRGAGGPSNVSVMIANGDGTFQTQQTFATGRYSVSVATGDLNGDGIPDLVVANLQSDSLSLLLGNGNGTFEGQQTIAAGPQPADVTIADLNGDGKPDLVVVNGNATIGVLLGNGNGTFQAQQMYSVPSSGPLAVVDVNGDSKPDLVVANGLTHSLSVLLGNGNGTFQAAVTFNCGAVPQAITAADVNGDGQPDLILGYYSTLTGGKVGVLLGNGNGTFHAEQSIATVKNPLSIQVADLNGDGKPDLLFANFGYRINTMSVLLGNGNGTFQTQQTFATGTDPYSMAVSDLNGDGRPDVIIANRSSATVSVLLSSANGNFTGQTYAIVPVLDTINGTSGNDTITLQRNTDGTDINWTVGASSGQFPANDPAGLTINGNGGNDTINLDYTNGNPLPSGVHLNGTFTINNLQGTNPLAGATLDIGRSTVFISYSSPDPLAAIQGYLKNGYNSGAWNGSPTATTGVITSAPAAANLNHTTGIGYADSADGQGVNTTPNTIELTYTLYGDANLDHQVNSADLQRFLNFFNTSGGGWDEGDFNYDGVNNSADQQIILFTFNTQLGNQATPLAVAATPEATTATATPSSSDKPSSHPPPAINATGPATTPVNHPHPARVTARKRR